MGDGFLSELDASASFERDLTGGAVRILPLTKVEKPTGLGGIIR